MLRHSSQSLTIFVNFDSRGCNLLSWTFALGFISVLEEEDNSHEVFKLHEVGANSLNGWEQDFHSEGHTESGGMATQEIQ